MDEAVNAGRKTTMTTSNYKSTIGGAFSALGTTLIGVGVVPQLSGVPNKFLTYVAVAGFLFTAIGQFLGHLFAADAATLRALSTQVNENSSAILTGDTTHLRKSQTEPPKP